VSYIVTSHKRLIDSDEKPWSNVWRIDATSIAQAQTKAIALQGAEANLCWDNVELYKLSIRQFLGTAAVELNTTQEGTRGGGDPDVQLPLFNTVRVDFSAASGRGSKFYMRPPLIEAEVLGFNLVNTYRDYVNDTIVEPIIALGYVLNSAGLPFTAGVVHTQVQMRQRGWHRRTRPGFRRGWVPV
jgi:hypothetical protein